MNVLSLFDERPARIAGRRIDEKGTRKDGDSNIDLVQYLEVFDSNKMNCVTTVGKDYMVSTLPVGKYPNVFERLSYKTNIF